MRRGVEIAAIYVERKLLKVFAKGFYVENKMEEICPEGGDNVQITEGNKKTIKLTESGRARPEGSQGTSQRTNEATTNRDGWSESFKMPQMREKLSL